MIRVAKSDQKVDSLSQGNQNLVILIIILVALILLPYYAYVVLVLILLFLLVRERELERIGMNCFLKIGMNCFLKIILVVRRTTSPQYLVVLTNFLGVVEI